MKKFLTALLSAVVTMVIATATLASAQTSSLRGSDTFTDVPEGHWADEAIGWAVENGITTGTSDTTFSPNDTLTRAHMVTFLHRYHTNVVSVETPSTTTTQAPTATGIYFVDDYPSADRETYFVVIGNVDGLDYNYCEVHLTLEGRRTGEWGNDIWSGSRSEVTIAVKYIEFDFDGFEAECS